MKLLVILAVAFGYVALFFVDPPSSSVASSPVTMVDSKVQPKDVVLSKNSKDPKGAPVPFSHETHSLKNYSADLKSVIGCAECHHTDQPKSALKPPLVTSQREVVLTTKVLEAPDAAVVKSCQSCHAKEGVKPTAWPENPKLTYPNDPDEVILTNEEAYHRNCNTCHDAVKLIKANTTAPTSCASCHSGKVGTALPVATATRDVTKRSDRQRSFLPQLGIFTSREDTLRKTAETLISDGRPSEATQALALLKKEEYLNFAGVDSKDVASVEPPINLTSEETEWKRNYADIRNRLVAIGAERRTLRSNQSRTVEEQDRLIELEKDIKVAGYAFQQLVNQLFNEFGKSVNAVVRIFHIKESRGLMQDLSELGSGAAALYTIVGKEKYWVILITPDVLLTGESLITADELHAKVGSFREVLQDPSQDPRRQAQELYDILIGPVAKDLKAARVETLMWSLDGPLRYLPIAALHDKQKYLVENYRNVVFTPASLARLKDVPSEKWRGLGLGVSKAKSGFSPLPGVTGELRGIIREENEKQPGGVMLG